jgi:hypothetical protein
VINVFHALVMGIEALRVILSDPAEVPLWGDYGLRNERWEAFIEFSA